MRRVQPWPRRLIVRARWIAAAAAFLLVGGAIVTAPGRAALAGLFLACGVVCVLLFRGEQRGRVVVALWVLLVVQLPIAGMAADVSPQLVQTVKGADDVILLLLALRAVWSRSPLPWWTVWAGGFLAFGLASGLILAVPLSILGSGLVLAAKLFLAVFVATSFVWTERDRQLALRVVLAAGAIVAALGLADLAFTESLRDFLGSPSYEGNGYRAQAVQSIFPGPARFSLMMNVVGVMMLASAIVRQRRADLLIAGLFFLAALASLRLKSLLGVIAVMLVVALLSRRLGLRSARRALPALAALAALGVVALWPIVRTQLEAYLGTDTARGELYRGAVALANEHLPLGVGFGRYGSFPSRTNYSPEYEGLGFDEMYGLSAQNPQFLTDTSWPAVLGEAGWLGLVCFGLSLLVLGLAAWRSCDRSFSARDSAPLLRVFALAALLVGVLFMVETIAAPTLFDGFAAVTLALFLGAGQDWPGAAVRLPWHRQRVGHQ